jgi:hypothetical protein
MVNGDSSHINGVPTFHAPPCIKWQLMITRIILKKSNMHHLFSNNDGLILGFSYIFMLPHVYIRFLTYFGCDWYNLRVF